MEPSRSDRDRKRALLLASGAVAGFALVASVDPNRPGHYPVCPSRALFGVDCPACGTLRGLHALAHGHIATALDHNVLLAVAVPLAAIALVLACLPLIGRPARTLRPPAGLVVAALTVAVAFAVVRNLPIDAVRYLGSGAG